MAQVMEHVQQLADSIGPRPAATDAEARAADYIEDVFRSYGLDVERQDFDTPRSRPRAFTVYHLLTIGAAVLSLWWGWPALALALVAAVLLLLDRGSRFSIAPFLGKGPSQNVIARHVPRQRRGERLRRVVILAHYDSAKPSLATGPGLGRHSRSLATLATWTTVATPVVIAIGLLPFVKSLEPWVSYASLVAAAYLVFPVIVNLHQELFMHPTDGANTNASGVAAMIGVLEATIPEGEDMVAQERPRRHGVEAAREAGVVPEEALLEYRPVGETAADETGALPLGRFDDVDWETGRLAPVAPTSPSAPVAPAIPPQEPAPKAAISNDWTEDAASLWEDSRAEPPVPPASRGPEERAAARPAPAPVAVNWGASRVPAPRTPEDDETEGQERLTFESPQGNANDSTETEREGRGISAWLGIGKGFDVRKAGKKIGTWDNIDDDDEFGFKAGTAGASDTIEAAARIRKRVTESVDRALSEKEIWFVATGADDAGGWGTLALLDAYTDDLRDALIINLDSVGVGTVNFVTEEGLMRPLHADRRLIAQAKRTAREADLPVKARSFRGHTTSVTSALARGFKAMSVMAFDINGRVPNRHWHTDTSENVNAATIEQAVAFVTAIVRDL